MTKIKNQSTVGPLLCLVGLKIPNFRWSSCTIVPLHVVDHPTQLICIWIFICCICCMSTDKYNRHSRAICYTAQYAMHTLDYNITFDLREASAHQFTCFFKTKYCKFFALLSEPQNTLKRSKVLCDARYFPANPPSLSVIGCY